MKKILLLINPISGKVQIRNYLLDIIQSMNQAGYETTVRTSAHPRHVTELVREYASLYDRIVVSGGDGTLNEAISGLMSLPEDQRPSLGYLPSGSTNDVAFGLGLPTDLEDAGIVACSGSPFPLDIGQFGDRFFTYVAAFGAFTEVPYQTPQTQKNVLGHTAYILEGAKIVNKIRPIHMRVTCEDQTIEDDILFGMVSNARSVGGMRDLAGKNVGLNDGVFEVTLVRNPVFPLLDFPSIIGSLITTNTENDPNFYTFKGSEMTFSFDEPVSWVLDGEYGGTIEEITIRNCHNAVRILTPVETDHSRKG